MYPNSNRISSVIHSSTNTAIRAGRGKGLRDWTAAVKKVVRLEALINHYESLGRLGFTSPQDSKWSDNITRRHLAGPSANIEVRKIIDERQSDKCWVDQREV